MTINLLKILSYQVEELTKELEFEISKIYQHEELNEKYNAQKILTDNLHKITTIIHQIKKLEKIYDEEVEENPENDKKSLKNL